MLTVGRAGRSVLKKLAYVTIGTVFLGLSIFFVVTVSYLAGSELLPAIRQGTLSVETNSMILNILWKGNEIYILLVAYLLVAGACAYGAIRAFKATTRRK